jgi:transcriptional regulator with XRE-family HTH domain
MAGPYFKEWRKERDLTLDQVADRLAVMEDPLIPKTPASLSRLENGKQPYTQRSLEALAFIYGIEPYELIGVNPREADQVQQAVGMLNGMDEVAKRRALKLLEALDAAEAPPAERAKSA